MATTPEMNKFFNRWLKGCQQLLALTQQQRDCIALGDFIKLNELLLERGRIMESLGNLPDHLPETLPFERRWEEVHRLLAKINELDRANQEQTALKVQSVKGDLKQLDKWRKAAQAYGGDE